MRTTASSNFNSSSNYRIPSSRCLKIPPTASSNFVSSSNYSFVSNSQNCLEKYDTQLKNHQKPTATLGDVYFLSVAGSETNGLILLLSSLFLSKSKQSLTQPHKPKNNKTASPWSPQYAGSRWLQFYR